MCVDAFHSYSLHVHSHSIFVLFISIQSFLPLSSPLSSRSSLSSLSSSSSSLFSFLFSFSSLFSFSLSLLSLQHLFNVHEDDVNCVSWNHFNEHLILTGSSDGRIRMIDRRHISGHTQTTRGTSSGAGMHQHIVHTFQVRLGGGVEQVERVGRDQMGIISK